MIADEISAYEDEPMDEEDEDDLDNLEFPGDLTEEEVFEDGEGE